MVGCGVGCGFDDATLVRRVDTLACGSGKDNVAGLLSREFWEDGDKRGSTSFGLYGEGGNAVAV